MLFFPPTLLCCLCCSSELEKHDEEEHAVVGVVCAWCKEAKCREKSFLVEERRSMMMTFEEAKK
jgi:hypothetical protein